MGSPVLSLLATTMVATQVAVVLHKHEQGLPEQHPSMRTENRLEPVCDEQSCMMARFVCLIFQRTLVKIVTSVRAVNRLEPVCDEQLCMVAGLACPIFNARW